MTESNQNHKRHRLSRSWQLTIYFLFALYVLFPFGIWGATGDASNVFIVGLVCFYPLGILILSLIFIYSVVTSPVGIEWHSFPFRKFIPWSAVEQLDINPFGFVNLRFQDKNGVSQRDLTSYVSDWRNSALISDIRKFAPQVEFPEDLLKRTPIKWFQIPGVILVLLLAELILGGALINAIRQIMTAWGFYDTQRPHVLLQAIGAGYMTGTFSGMACLWSYNSWLADRQSDARVSVQAFICYIQPWSGALLGAILGVLLFFAWSILFGQTREITEANESWIRFAGILGGISQMYVHPRIVAKIDAMP